MIGMIILRLQFKGLLRTVSIGNTNLTIEIHKHIVINRICGIITTKKAA